MSKSGKTTLTILLVVVAVLLLSLSAIALFFYQNESKLRKEREVELAQVKASEEKLKDDLKETKKQAFLLEEKGKEADEKINNLLDELELAQGVRDEIKNENATLKEALTKEGQEKESLQKELASLQDKVKTLETQVESETQARAQLEEKVKDYETEPVQLEKIVVTPDEAAQGKILSVNKENDFVIFNLGQKSGINPEMLLSVYRGNNYLGDIKVARVQDDMSVADFVPPLTSAGVRQNDRVIAKK